MFIEPRFIETNGIRLACYEAGSGSPIIMVHGFPELAFSWRHQISAFADAGYHAIAPDMRGYGASDGPEGIDQYTMATLIADLHGLLDDTGFERATFVGHDWGAIILWHMAMLAPQRMERLIALNIPHVGRWPVDPIDVFRDRLGDDFYIVNFQDSQAADAAFAADPGHFFDMMMRKNQVTRAQFEKLPPTTQVLSLLKVMARSESSGDPLLSDKERDYYVKAFERSGFTNPINWYRNWSRNWKAIEGIDSVIRVPTLFIGAADDVVISPDQIEAMKPLVENLTIEILEPCGHWTQQERPDDVNRIVLDWLQNT